MSARPVSSFGSLSEAVGHEFFASGVIHPGDFVDFIRTSGIVVGPSTQNSTTTMIFGFALGPYIQGASNAVTRVIPFAPDQLWEVDCANAASTAQIGLRHALSESRNCVHNTASDVTGHTGVFLAVGMTGIATGSGKLIGKFISNIVPVGGNQTTYA